MNFKEGRDIEPESAKKLLMQPDVFVLDVRTPLEFRGGYLPGAVLIPVDELERRMDELPEEKSSTILVYCAHGVRSAYARSLLEKNGYMNVYNLKRGLVSI